MPFSIFREKSFDDGMTPQKTVMFSYSRYYLLGSLSYAIHTRGELTNLSFQSVEFSKQILVSQISDFHFADYRSLNSQLTDFLLVSFRFVSQIT